MKKFLFTIAVLLIIMSTKQSDAHVHFSMNWGYHRPVMHCVQPVRRMYCPVYYVAEPYYMPIYQPAVVQYIDNRDPKLAMIQDGFNMMFDAASRSSRCRSRHRCR